MKEEIIVYSTMDNAKDQCKLQEITIMADINAQVRKEQDGVIVGKY